MSHFAVEKGCNSQSGPCTTPRSPGLSPPACRSAWIWLMCFFRNLLNSMSHMMSLFFPWKKISWNPKRTQQDTQGMAHVCLLIGRYSYFWRQKRSYFWRHTHALIKPGMFATICLNGSNTAPRWTPALWGPSHPPNILLILLNIARRKTTRNKPGWEMICQNSKRESGKRESEKARKKKERRK